MSVAITLIGGPTALIEIDGVLIVTDPTFDQPGAYRLPHVTLEKLTGPALSAEKVGSVDAVLLSHDQHADNLDHSGKDFLARASRVLTTEAGAKRLGAHVEGLAPWASAELTGKNGVTLNVTATPARHGPAGIEPLSGDVIGFVVSRKGGRPIYISGDTTWFEWRGGSTPASCCPLPAPRKPAARSISPWTPTTRSRLREPLPTR